MGDFRPGSITAVLRRCGKPRCHCAKPHDPGHERQFRLTLRGARPGRKRSPPTAFRKAQREVSEFHRFQKWSADYWESRRG